MKQVIKILTFSVLYSSSFGQSKTGFFDYERIIQSVPEYRVEWKSIETTRILYQDTLARLMTGYQQFLEKRVPHNSKMDSTEMLALQDTIRQMEQIFRNYQLSAQTQIARAQDKVERELKRKVSMALERFCSDNGIISMAEKDAVMFCTHCKDYTDDFISYLSKVTTR